MYKSIQQFQSLGLKKIKKVSDEYIKDPSKIAELVKGITNEVVDLGLSLIADEWNEYDDLYHSKKELRPGWYVVRTDETTLGTSLGEVHYHKTLFKNKVTGEYKYFLDELMGIDSHTRITEDAEARLLEEAVDSSYQKGGMNASISNFTVSKQTVMNKLRVLNFPSVAISDAKRQVKTIYIDADEDHVSLQYLEKKGDIKNSYSNTYMPKMVYVYEGVEAQGNRRSLINVKYFGGGYEGTKGTEALWDAVYQYIENEYDEEALEKIYINGDGASWIKAGANIHGKAKFVLDKFHMHKYIIAATAHLMDSAEDARREIFRAINGKRKWQAEGVFDHILMITESESKRKAVEASKTYILGQWTAIMTSINNKKDKLQCSAEGHISHVYADRLSSRPLGWSKEGADKMAQLRIYKWNQGDMLELVRYQKEELPMAAGAEERITTATEMMRSIKKNEDALGLMADLPFYTIPYPQIKKIASLKNRIWGL